MAKIYNEIVIDMNPESPTFEETLYEDSYEYEGDMMLMQFEYGMESLSKDSFFRHDGKPKPPEEIVKLIIQHKPWDETMKMSIQEYEKDVRAKVMDFMPRLQEIDPEKEGFLEEDKATAMGKAEDQYGLSTRAAERGLQSSLGEAQKQASSLGGSMRSAYGGMGSGIRGAIGGQKSLAKGVESTYGAYGDEMLGAQQQRGYAEEAADLTQRKGMYGLEQEQEAEFEGDIGSWLDSFKQGGRVPLNKKQTFLDVLSKIPDAGGS